MADTDTAELERPETAQAVAVPTPNSSIGDLIKMPEGLRNDLMVNRDDLAKANKATIDQTDRRDDEDRARAIKAYNAGGIGPDDLPKWDVEKERQKHATNPIESFGSFASVFAIAAAAFTKAPMENALNGAAAAMNAIRAGNEHEYEAAYGVWKENNAIAIKRAEIMHRQYQDAMDMRKVDMTRGDVKLRQLALQFGDKQAITFLEHGMDPQFFELISTRAKVTEGLIKSNGMMQDYSFRQQALESDPRWHSNDPGQKMLAFNYNMNAKAPEEKQIMGLYYIQHPKATAEEAAKFYRDEVHPLGRGGQGITTQPRLDAQEVQRRAELYTKEFEKQGMPPAEARTAGFDKARREIREDQAPPITGNKRYEVEGHIEQYYNSIDKIDAIKDVVSKHVGTVGATGYARRIEERLSNVLGSDRTDFQQVERDLAYLQLMGTRLLTDQATGKPLSAEHAAIGKIIGGLKMGDTTANTLRALDDVQMLYTKMAADAERRLKGRSAQQPSGGRASSADKLKAGDVVVQNGVKFQKQPDGSMKALQ